MFNKRINLLKGPNRLLTKTQLGTMDYVYMGKPFFNVVSKEQETKNLDTVYLGKIFIGSK
jgi:hypothetical protein